MSLWSFTVDDTSPVLSYAPARDVPSVTTGWRTWYSRSGFDTSANEGDSFHATGMNGARVNLQFYGTAISLRGFTNTTYDVIVDTMPFPSLTPTGDVLFSVENLFEGTHYVSLVNQGPTNASQLLVFDHALISTPLQPDEIPMQPVPYYANSTNFQRLGPWETSNTGSGDGPMYLETIAEGATVALNFTGTRVVSVRGQLSPEGATYSVTLNGIARTYNTTSDRMVPDALLYLQPGLDPQRQYQITVSNVAAGRTLAISSVTTYQQQLRDSFPPLPSTDSDPPPPSRSDNLGIIIGPVAGSIGFILILGFLFRWWSRRRSKQRYFKQHDPSLPPFSLGRQRVASPNSNPSYGSHSSGIVNPQEGSTGIHDVIMLDKRNIASDQNILLAVNAKSSNKQAGPSEAGSVSAVSTPSNSPVVKPAPDNYGGFPPPASPQPIMTASETHTAVQDSALRPPEKSTSPVLPNPVSSSSSLPSPAPTHQTYPTDARSAPGSPARTVRKLPMPPVPQQQRDNVDGVLSGDSLSRRMPENSSQPRLPSYRP
ncbi:hypothetical protein AX16_000470 [Volvariella volvacea WC 439]|nr:hypothetical protein AX16_000470 [Volvariella volvacea WC 439]